VCGRFTSSQRREAIGERFEVAVPETYQERINARAETLTEKPAYRSLISRHRCLLPADGFYEWTVGTDDKKQPIHFHLPDYELFAFAGLWTSRTDEETGEIIESCTIITTRPNELVAPVHDRMPVILPTDAERVWLDPVISKEHASLLEPYPADLRQERPCFQGLSLSGERGSNPRPSAWEADALPTELSPRENEG
jgi:putative SOS response-associated peptidase YedK